VASSVFAFPLLAFVSSASSAMAAVAAMAWAILAAEVVVVQLAISTLEMLTKANLVLVALATEAAGLTT
jgi:heme A synthase